MKCYEIYINNGIPMDRYFTQDSFDIDKTNLDEVTDFCRVFNKYNNDGARAYFEEVAAPEYRCYKFSAYSAY